jgi:hypothetical protein
LKVESNSNIREFMGREEIWFISLPKKLYGFVFQHSVHVLQNDRHIMNSHDDEKRSLVIANLRGATGVLEDALYNNLNRSSF